MAKVSLGTLGTTAMSIVDRLRDLAAGARLDFTFAWEGAPGPNPWDHLPVVRFAAREAISTLYRYDITVLLRGPGLGDPEELLGARACLRIASLTDPGFRIVHGIITEAQELALAPEGMLYRVTLEPPLALAQRRTRSRIFLDKTLRQIIDAVLAPIFTRADGAAAHGDEHHPLGFTPAAARFCYRITDVSRLDNPAARPYCVQYNESDHAFLSRILEDEGIAYHFEHGSDMCLLVLSDADEGKTWLAPFRSLGPGVHGRDITAITLGARLREKAVRLLDYDWRKPNIALHAEAGTRADLFEDQFPGAFQDKPALGAPLARARLDRHAVEASYATGSGGVRVLSAGTVFHLDHDGTHHDGEYLVTRLELEAEQAGVVSLPSGDKPEPFKSRFECVRRGRGSRSSPSRFRPARTVQKPRIVGSQTAFVTAEPSTKGAEIHVGGPPGAEIGCVRLRFHWDHDPERHDAEPTSCWVRVSHAFAGAGRGALFHPRVDDEVVVEFLDGDPDRPIVTGCVYNGQNLPPAPASGSPTVSTMKSFSTPGAGVVNEFAFDDAKGRERVVLNAGRDFCATVGHDRAEKVTNDSNSRVGVNRSERTGSNRSTDVGGDNAEHVAGNESIAVDGNQNTTIGSNRSARVGADDSLSVAANRTAMVGASDALNVAAAQRIQVGADQTVDVGGSRAETVAGSANLVVAGSRSIAVAGSDEQSIAGSRTVAIGGSVLEAIGAAFLRSIAASAEGAVGADASLATGGGVNVQAGGSVVVVAQGEAAIQAPLINLTADGEIVLSAGGSAIKIGAGGVEIMGPSVSVAGGTVNVAGGLVKLN
ncbi:type VI secretion system Vgr family protein [Polyangium fumosum]|nr:type VI secretion system tip protein TssI/VgrG [Polyangium fumosum]